MLSRATKNAVAGHMWPAVRCLPTSVLLDAVWSIDRVNN